MIVTKLEVEQKKEAAKAVDRTLESVEPGFDSLKAIKEARGHG